MFCAYIYIYFFFFGFGLLNNTVFGAAHGRLPEYSSLCGAGGPELSSGVAQGC